MKKRYHILLSDEMRDKADKIKEEYGLTSRSAAIAMVLTRFEDDEDR